MKIESNVKMKEKSGLGIYLKVVSTTIQWIAYFCLPTHDEAFPYLTQLHCQVEEGPIC